MTAYTLGPYGDTVTISGGNALRLAATDVRRQLFEVAAGTPSIDENNQFRVDSLDDRPDSARCLVPLMVKNG